MYDVIIAGAGPNGLLMATELAIAGVKPIVLERHEEVDVSPKANGLVGQVNQALDYRGIYERFAGTARPPTPFPQYPFAAMTLDLAGVDRNPMYGLPIPQRRMEELLAERARELDVEIRRGHEVKSLTQQGESVIVLVATSDGEYELEAKYLVAADGGRSAIRKHLGIGFPGITDTSFIGRAGMVGIDAPTANQETGELDLPGVGVLRPMTFTRTEGGLFAFAMFVPGQFRVTFLEWSDADLPGDDVPVTFDELGAAARRVLGAELPMHEPPDGVPTMLGRSTDGINSRQAERYREGRVFLVGDAAHVHSAMGAPGLNLGLQDTLNLGWKLAATLNGWAPDGLLDTYDAERRPVGERVLMHTRAQLALVAPGPNVTALRELFGELLQEKANVQRIADLMSGADVRYEHGDHDLTGRFFADRALHVDGGLTRFAHLMRAARPVLLVMNDRPDLVDLVAGWADRVEVVRAQPVDHAPPAEAVLVRPDGYVAWAGSAVEGLEQALATWFGAARARV